jgi:hypothetical protein
MDGIESVELTRGSMRKLVYQEITAFHDDRRRWL